MIAATQIEKDSFLTLLEMEIDRIKSAFNNNPFIIYSINKELVYCSDDVEPGRYEVTLLQSENIIGEADKALLDQVDNLYKIDPERAELFRRSTGAPISSKTYYELVLKSLNPDGKYKYNLPEPSYVNGLRIRFKTLSSVKDSKIIINLPPEYEDSI